MNAGRATPDKSAARPASMLGDLAPRLISGLVMIALALGTLMSGGFVFVAFWLVAAIAVHWEWQRMTGGPHEQVRMAGGAAIVALVAGFAALGARDAAVFTLVGGAFATLIFISGPTRVWNAAGILYAGALILAVVVLRFSIFNGFEAILWLFAIVWGTDVMAYFGGRLIGGPKLWPRVSPSKTWAGFLTGVVSGSLLGVLVLWVRNAPLSPAPIILLALAAPSRRAGTFSNRPSSGATDARIRATSFRVTAAPWTVSMASSQRLSWRRSSAPFAPERSRPRMVCSSGKRDISKRWLFNLYQNLRSSRNGRRRAGWSFSAPPGRSDGRPPT